MNKFILVQNTRWEVLIHNGKIVFSDRKIGAYGVLIYLRDKKITVDYLRVVDSEKYLLEKHYGIDVPGNELCSIAANSLIKEYENE